MLFADIEETICLPSYYLLEHSAICLSTYLALSGPSEVVSPLPVLSKIRKKRGGQVS
jgi:hypothetical protein